MTKKLSRRDAIKLLGAAAGASLLANLPSKWSKPSLTSGVMPAHAQTSNPVPVVDFPTVITVSIVPGIGGPPRATFTGNITNDGGSPILDRGFVWDSNPNPTLLVAPFVVSLGSGGLGVFSVNNQSAGPDGIDFYGRAYATNSVGTAYGADIIFQTETCLAEGTLIRLADGSQKKIEDIQYSDHLLVWNFDEGRFDQAQPLWIKKKETTSRFNLLEFSDGSTLKTISQHRIFNKEMGMFTYPMTEDTPLGTTTFNVNGEEVTLVGKRVVHEPVNYYNIITHTHINLFANGILTSCRYNNLYPIRDMKFVKDNRALVPQSAYGVEEKYYEGLRLGEQTIAVADTIAYINRLKAREIKTIPVLA